ncbi:MAG: CPBP family intramembrane metalloprotease [Acidobacteria bacterium]|nr:CPBP family intramembrane metalloprotease [Acidobacteriota bacterium]
MSSPPRNLILVSPLAIMALGHLTARVTGTYLGEWAWIPVNLVLWSSFAAMIHWGGGKQSISRWLGPSVGGWGWSALAVFIGLIPLPIFLKHWDLLSPISIWLPWILFALINPALEEFFWRGLLLDHAKSWPAWLAILVSSLLFALNHPLSFGVNSIANRHPATFISTLLMGQIWAVTYQKTKSLRATIVAHTLVDLLNLSIPVFLNLYVPPR